MVRSQDVILNGISPGLTLQIDPAGTRRRSNSHATPFVVSLDWCLAVSLIVHTLLGKKGNRDGEFRFWILSPYAWLHR